MKLKKSRKRLLIALVACVAALAVGLAGAYVYYYSRLRMIGRGDGYIYAEHTDAGEEEDDDIGVEVGYEDVDATSLDEFLRNWATNSIQKLQDKNILNILLCGVDSRNGQASGGRSDAILLVSVNKRTRAVTLVSFFRDSYTYIDLMGDPNRPRTVMDKVNAAYSLGGPRTLIDTLEANYKIKIDGYISVDFNSFPKLINALGGVTLDVGAAEASYINRTAPSMHHSFPSGNGVTLNGAQALVYSRIRHLAGGDIDRTARQRKVILGILQSARGASNGQILNAANQVIAGRYLSTNLTDRRITSLVADAFTDGWLNYAIVEYNTPTVDGPNATGIPTQRIQGDKWFWVVDYPRAAEELQLLLYGTTSIALTVEGEERSDYLAKLFKEAASHNGGSSSSSGGGGKTTTRPAEEPTLEETEPWTSEETTAPQETTTEPENSWPWWRPTRPHETTEPPVTTEEEATQEETQPPPETMPAEESGPVGN